MSDDSEYKAPVVIILVDSGSAPAVVTSSKPTAKVINASPNPKPEVNFIGTPLSGYNPLTVNFTDQSTNNPTSWLWDFGDGNTSTLQNPENIYSAPGTYSVELMASNSGGSSSLLKTAYIVAYSATDFIGDQTTVPTTLLFGNNVFSTNNIVIEPTTLLFGNNVFSTNTVATFPVSFVPLPLLTVISVVTILSNMTYSSAYTTAFPSAAEVGGTFDTTLAGTGVTFPNNNTSSFLDAGTTSRGTVIIAGSNQWIGEFHIDSIGTGYAQVGVFIQAFGPYFDPNTQYGGALSSYYDSTGHIHGYGSSPGAPNAATFTTGDIIGVVLDQSSDICYFFKNGVQQSATANMSNNVGWLMAGT